MFTETVTYNTWNTTSSWLTAHSSKQVGRMYDPLVGRMLSPDIVIQNPEYSQSYNRYTYCFNNPLRFTDPSGYVVTIPPEYLLMNLYSTDINKYRKKIKRLGVDPNTISVDYNTDHSQDGLLFKTISWKEIGVDDPEDKHYLDVFEYDFSDAINNEQSYPILNQKACIR